MRRTFAATGAALVLSALPATAAGTTVRATDNAFTPQSVTVSVGDTVTWRNDGDNAHEVTASAFKSGNLDPGKSYTWTASKAGTFSYVCRYHESLGMKGTVVVRAAGATTGHPNTGGDRMAFGLLLVGVSVIAGASLRYGWRVR
jgi:plastocyanin